jgi:hypothetical protein
MKGLFVHPITGSSDQPITFLARLPGFTAGIPVWQSGQSAGL